MSEENEQILQETAEIDTLAYLERKDDEYDEEYFRRVKRNGECTDQRFTVDYIAKLIVIGENCLAFQLLEHCFDCFDTRSPDDCFTTTGHSLIELAVRANNKEAVEYLFANCTNASDMSCDYVMREFLAIQPLRLAIQLGHNEIAKYLYDCESQSTFPGDVTSIQAIHHAMFYKNDDLVNHFTVMFGYYHPEIITLLIEKNT